MTTTAPHRHHEPPLARANARAQARRQLLVASGERRTPPSPKVLLAPVFLVALGVAGLTLRADLAFAASTAMIAGLIGLGIFLPLATLQELPLNAAGLAGLSAYVFAYFASDGSVGRVLLGVLAALVVVTALSTFGGAASIVVTGLYFTVASLVIQIGLEKVVFSSGKLTGGAAGRSVEQPYLTGWFNTQRLIYVVVGVSCLLATALVWAAMRRRVGFHAVLVGASPEGASAVGLCNWRWKLLVFAMSGSIIAVAGCLTAFGNGTPPPPIAFNVIWSVVFLALPMASGMRNLRSLWLVAAAYTVVPVLLQHHHIEPNLLSGIILMAALLTSQVGPRALARLRQQPGDGPEEPTVVPEPTHVVRQRIASTFTLAPDARVGLSGRELAVSFGGVHAVAGVDIHVEPGERLAIVGGNGAGKTTLFNALTGFVPLTAGSVQLGGVDVTGRQPYQIARAGIRRTFQIPRLADPLSVTQNVRCGQGGEVGTSAARVDFLMDRFGLTPVRDLPIAALPFGYRRKTEIVRALARGPRILMMDEPVSGLEDDEVTDILDVLLDLQADEGWGMVVIEHDLRFVTGIAERLLVMEDGHVMTEGDLATVLTDDRVRRVYLGDLV
jgi:branched-chain amino acid transport system permease protein